MWRGVHWFHMGRISGKVCGADSACVSVIVNMVHSMGSYRSGTDFGVSRTNKYKLFQWLSFNLIILGLHLKYT